MTSKELKYILNLEDYPNTYIQKVLGSSISIYIISYNSRYPNKFISAKKLRTTPTAILYKLKQPTTISKLSQPVLLDAFNNNIALNSLIFVRDLGGENVIVPRDVIPVPLESDTNKLFDIPVAGSAQMASDLLSTIT